MNLKNYIADVYDFPKTGIVFKDISPLLTNPAAYAQSISDLEKQWDSNSYDKIAAFDARGFLFGSPLALQTEKPLVMLRKKGKLPGKTESISYGLEYGSSELEVQSGLIEKGDRVLFIDDLLATGGTARAGIDLVQRFGGEVAGVGFVIELASLGGRDVIGDYPTNALLRYE